MLKTTTCHNTGIHHVGLFARDPDGNMIEVYWPTGDDSRRQPHAMPLDLNQPDDVLLEQVHAGAGA